MSTHRIRRSFVLLPALLAGIGIAVSAGATAGKVVPKCKPGQNSTKAHPCTKVKKPSGSGTKPATRPSTGSGSSAPASDSGGSPLSNPCAPGLSIPQQAGGDDDDDNNGGPDDGDGCL